MVFYDAKGDGKPEAGAFADLLGGEERVKNFVEMVGFHAVAGVGDADDETLPVGAALGTEITPS